MRSGCFAEALPDHPGNTEAARRVGGLLGISPETSRTWARREEIDAGLAQGVIAEAENEIRRLKRESAELLKANEIRKAASVYVAKELEHPTTR